ncbi:MAG: NAD(+) synthase [Clostridia bacterium]|nr:NAD(+) synthase [Clostridia bacterium]
MSKLCDNINSIKKQKGLTLAALSQASGVPLGTLNKICSGAIKSINANHLAVLADALGVSVQQLLDGNPCAATSHFGFVRVSAQSVTTRVGDVKANADCIASKLHQLSKRGVKIALFSELSLCGATAGDLLASSTLLSATQTALGNLLKQTAHLDVTFVVGAPVVHERKVFDAALVCRMGKMLGVVPKTALCSKQLRWFEQDYTCATTTVCNQQVPFGKLVFQNSDGFRFACAFESEIPQLYKHKGNVDALFVLGASACLVGGTETVTVALQALSQQVGAVIYCNAHFTESTSYNVYSAHALIAERGKVLAQNDEFGQNDCICEIDVNLPANPTAFDDAVQFAQDLSTTSLVRKFNPTPFVPQKAKERSVRCEQILTMQSHALAKRLQHTGSKKAVIGVSGGLDSSLALLVAKRAFELLGKDVADIVAVTMPCFGTTERTLNNSIALARIVGATIKKVDICASVTQHLKDIGHDFEPNVTLENAQARERTQVLMDMANQLEGIVVGTGDLSEIALGWSTFNGDHISMYNPNCDVPKTLIPHLIAHESKKMSAQDRQVVESIIDTPISPELLPTKKGEIVQKTEDLVGPYVLHDFFLHCFAKGYDVQKTLFVACQTFTQFDKSAIHANLTTFVKRFFTQQFKRNCAADGVQIGSVSLSYGNWQMPSDAVGTAFLDQLN